jgi:predicted GNAT family acetyltransferase
MQIDAEKLNVVHNTRASRFEVQVGEELAVLEYQMRGNKMIFTHTGVPEALEGQGIASRMARVALDYAREKAHAVVPACEFMEVYLRRHPEYKSLVPG